jgi:hypothetical protein
LDKDWTTWDNPKELVVNHSRTRIGLGIATLVAAGAGAVVTAAPSQAAAPDTACMRAGIATLKSAGLIGTVAKNGLSIDDAVALGVTVRDGASLEGIPDPLPLSLILADHRAGENSTFVYPWAPCPQ